MGDRKSASETFEDASSKMADFKAESLDTPDALVDDRRVLAGTISVLGLLFLVGNVGHLVGGDHEFWPFVLQVAFVGVFPSVLIVSGYLLFQSRFGPKYIRHVVLRTMIGMLLMSSVMGWVVLHEYLDGHTLPEPLYLTLSVGTAGALGGLVIGVHSALAKRRHDQLKSAHSELQERQETFAFLNRLLRHHVLNGIQIVRGKAELLMERADPALHDDLSSIVSRSETIAELVENMDYLTRELAGETVESRVELRRTLERECNQLAELYPDVRLETDVPDTLWVQADELVGAVFGNVFINAVEHNDKATPEVSISAEVREQTVRIRAADNGPGIGTDEKEAVFERSKNGDRGLGLYLVKTLVGRYGGEVWIEDNSPEGAVVVVELRRVEPAE